MTFRIIALLATLSSVIPTASARRAEGSNLCSKVVGLLATYFVNGTPQSELARVEVRQCSIEEGQYLQLVAWPGGESARPLLIDTGKEVIVQAVSRENIFVVEIAGGSSDLVFVVGYKGGNPELLLKRATKGIVEVKTTQDAVDLEITSFAADSEPQEKRHYHYKLSYEAMKPPKSEAVTTERPEESEPVVTSFVRPEDVPFALRIASLEYPRVAAEAQISGTVVLRVRIDKGGVVSHSQALSGPSILVFAAEENIKLWKFSVAGSPVARPDSEFNFTYIFKLIGASHSPRPGSELIYEYPNKVTVTSKAVDLH
jgi:hypothetical protein